MKLFSPAFADGGRIPAKYSRKADNIAPPLFWEEVPHGTKSFALVVDDPDAPDPAHPKMTWVHWVAYNIPAETQRLPEGSSKCSNHGMKEGLNDWKHVGYEGPQPPIGLHRYFCKLYALDSTLEQLSEEHPTKAALEKAMQGHILAKAVLVGTFGKTA